MEHDIKINNLNVHYDETGPQDGHPVILMHGWGCNLSTVRSIATCLEGGMHVYSIDLPGHGKSDEPGDVWGVEDYTRLIENFTKALDIDNPSLIGHSFGGRIAILYSSRNPASKVVLVDSAGIKPHRGFSYYRKVYSFKLLKRIALLLFGKEKGERKIEQWRNKKGSADYRNSSPMMRRVMSKCVNEDLRGVMPSIKSPTLLIWGEADTATPLGDAKIMERLIPDAGLVSFPDCGHYSFLDNPGAFKAVIREFFKNDMKSIKL